MRPLLIGLLWLSVATSHGASLAGQQVQGGGQIEIRFPVAKYFQDIAAEAGNPRVETGRAVLAFPPGFDPGRPWPILVVTSSSDFGRTSAMVVPWYRPPATAEGWVVLGSGRNGPAAHRFHPVATRHARRRIGGCAKGLAPVRQMADRFRGFLRRFQTQRSVGRHARENRVRQDLRIFSRRDQRGPLGESYRTYQPGRGFLEVPVWLSSGTGDTVATPQDHNLVKASLERIGFKRVHLEQFAGQHQLKRSEVRRAFRWFRQLGKF